MNQYVFMYKIFEIFHDFPPYLDFHYTIQYQWLSPDITLSDTILISIKTTGRKSLSKP